MPSPGLQASPALKIGGLYSTERWEATCGRQDGSRISREHPERLSQSSLSKKLAFMRSVMTGREAKTPIKDRNYIQVQRVDYAHVMTDLSNACQTGEEMD